MAGLAAVLPLNVWIYAGQLQNLAAAGRKFILQGGTHRNLAVVKAQVDFIRSKVLKPRSWCILLRRGGRDRRRCVRRDDAAGYLDALSRIRGDRVARVSQHTNEHTTCVWCPVSCKRTFIDVRLPNGRGRPWSKCRWPPAGTRHQRKFLSQRTAGDVNEMRVVKKNLESVRDAHPNTAEMVRESAFRRAKTFS